MNRNTSALDLGVDLTDGPPNRRPSRISVPGIIRRRRRSFDAQQPNDADGDSPAGTLDVDEAGETDEADLDGEGVGPHRNDQPTPPSRSTRIWIYAVMPIVALLLTLAAAYLKYDGSTSASTRTAATESVAAAKDIVTQMLSYAPGTAQETLTKAGDRMSGPFRESFLSLVKDVVAPGARQKDVSATATVPAAAVTSSTSDTATLVLFIDQTITVGNAGPTSTASVVQVRLEKNHGRWLMTQFEPK